MREIRRQDSHTTAELLGGKPPATDRSIGCFGGAMHEPRHHYVTPTNIKPFACPRCKLYARLIQRAPLPAGLDGEMRTFECKKCSKQTKIIVQD
jgi:hypothetical protein